MKQINKRNRKSIKDIEKEIIRVLLENKSPISVQTITENTNSNWLTIERYCRRLEDKGVLKMILVEGRVVGLELNIEYYNLIDEVFRELEAKEPSVFQKMINDKRIIICKEEQISGDKR